MSNKEKTYFVVPSDENCHLIAPEGKEKGDQYEAETLCGLTRMKSDLEYQDEKGRRNFCQNCLKAADLA